MDIFASCGPNVYTVQAEPDWCVRTLLRAVKTAAGGKKTRGRCSLLLDGNTLEGPLRNTQLTDGSLVQVRVESSPHDVSTHTGAQKECRRLHIKIGRDAFVNAIAHRNLERMELLLSTGEDLGGGVLRPELKTALMIAVKHRHHDIADMLLRLEGFPVAETTNTYRQRRSSLIHKKHAVNALYFAVRNVDIEMVRLLLRHGALAAREAPKAHFVGRYMQSPLVTLAGVCGKSDVRDEDVLCLWDILFPAWEEYCEARGIPCTHFQPEHKPGWSLAAYCAYTEKFVLLQHLVTKAYVAANPVIASSVLSACIYRSRAAWSPQRDRHVAEVERLRSIGAAPCYVLRWRDMAETWTPEEDGYENRIVYYRHRKWWLPFSKASGDIVEGFDVRSARQQLCTEDDEDDDLTEHAVRKSFTRRGK